MADNRATRGVPLPSVGQIVVVAAALVAVWLLLSRFGRGVDDGGRSGNAAEGWQALEAQVSRGADAVPELLKSLESSDPRERRLAAYGLGRIGPAASAALEKLRQCLADENPHVRENAAFAVRCVDPDPEAAAVAIAALLADPQQNVRDAVEKELLQIGSPAFKPLLETLHGRQAAARMDSLGILRGTHVTPYFQKWKDHHAAMAQAVRGLLADSDAGVRIEAMTLLAEWDEASLAEVGELLRSGDNRRAGVALSAASRMKEEAVILLPDILVLLDQGPPGRVLPTLIAMKSAARPAAPRLIKLCATARNSDQLAIAETLAAIDADPEDIARILGPLLLIGEESRRNVAGRAAALLLQVNPAAARRQVTRLIPKLLDESGNVDRPVLQALQDLGPEAAEAVPTLIPLLQHSDSWVVEFTAHALRRAGPGAVAAAPQLADVVCSVSRPYPQRIACVYALASLGPGAQATTADLLQLIAGHAPGEPHRENILNNDWALRAAVVTALGWIGGDDAGLIPALRVQLKSPSYEVRAAAADALGRVAGQSAEVLAELIPLLYSDIPIVRAQAALAIGRSTVDRHAAVPRLIGTLSDENPAVQIAAAIALGKIGPAASEALPALQERLTAPLESGRNSGSQYVNIPDLNQLSFEQAARRAIAAIASGAIEGNSPSED